MHATCHVKVMALSCGTFSSLCSCYLTLELCYLEGRGQQIKTVHATTSHLQFLSLTVIWLPKYFCKILGKTF